MTEEIKLVIWDREFKLPVQYDCYKGETITEAQISALKAFATHSRWIADAKSKAEAFCKEEVLKDQSNNKKDNIFSYLKPDYLFIKREKEKPRVALMCKYRYDLEHGIAIVFNHDGKVVIGPQDIIL